jgi:hypothetical protein
LLANGPPTTDESDAPDDCHLRRCVVDGDGISSVYNPADAIFTAASYLCRNGGGRGGDLSRAVFAYNHASWYVTKVLTIASTYEAATPTPLGGGPALPPNHDVAGIAIQFAHNQLDSRTSGVPRATTSTTAQG